MDRCTTGFQSYKLVDRQTEVWIDRQVGEFNFEMDGWMDFEMDKLLDAWMTSHRRIVRSMNDGWKNFKNIG